MSTDPDRTTACPDVLQPSAFGELSAIKQTQPDHGSVRTKPGKGHRKVSFPPEDGQLVTEYFEPANPWQDVPSTSREQLVVEYLESCRRHRSPPIPCVLDQIQELPENAIGGATRAPRLTLSECALEGAAPADALEAVLRRTQFRRLEIDHATIDDEGVEALFDMIEYYESATILSIAGPRDFGVRGWQAASRMIKKSAELSELEVHSGVVEASHAAVLARALRPHSCRLRALALQRAALAGEPLLCLVIALKSNSSVRELRLGDNRLGCADAAQLAALLRANALIQLLDLSNNQIQDAGAGHIAEALVDQSAQTPPSAATSPLSPHRCPLGGYESRGLAFLVLWNNQLTRNCANHLSKALRSSSSLCVLNVGRNALGCETIKSLHGPAIVSLGLQAARLGPDAAKSLADLIRHSPGLQRLDLRDNRLGGGGLQAIQQAMKDNRTLIQIDLDDTTEPTTTLSAEASTAATCARLTREIRALCQRNEPLGSAHRVHRKISLTCRSACLQPGVPEEERKGGRLRSPDPSPAPSPAGSPIPGASPHSRFSVTRVTPDRESSTSSNESGSPSASSPSPSRFRVMQVTEPPQIQVQPAEPRRSSSRFSVTRNYDTMYNFTPRATAMDLSKPDRLTAKDSVPVANDSLLVAKDSVLVANDSVILAKDSALVAIDSVILAKDSALEAKDSVPMTKSKDSVERDLLTAKYNLLVTKVAKAAADCDVLVSKDSVLMSKAENPAECEILLTKATRTTECDVQITQDSVPMTKAVNESAECEDLMTKDSVLIAKTAKATAENPECDVLNTKNSVFMTTADVGTPECEVFMAKDSVLMPKEANIDVHTAKSGVKVTPDGRTAKDGVTPQIDANKAKADAQDVKLGTQTSRNEEPSSTVVQSDQVVIQTAMHHLHSTEEVIKTAVVVQEAEPNLQLAKEIQSTSETSISTISEDKPDCLIMGKEMRNEEQIAGQTVKGAVEEARLKTDNTQIVKDAILVSKERGVVKASCDVAIAKNVPSEVSNQCGSVKSDTPVTSDGESDKTVSDTADSKRDVPVGNSEAESDTMIGESDKTVKTDGNSDAAVGEGVRDKDSDVSVKNSTYKDKTEQIYHDERRQHVGHEEILVRESKLLTNTTEVSETERLDVKVEVSVKLETVDSKCENKLDNSSKTSVSSTVNNHPAKVHSNQNAPSERPDHRNDEALRQIAAITEDLNLIIQDMQSISTKTSLTRKASDASTVKSNYTQTDAVQSTQIDTVTTAERDSVILKKNKSESSLDSPDLEVSRLMTKRPVTYCDSSSSYSGSSMESLTAERIRPTIVERTVDTSLDRRKAEVAFSTGSSLESNDATPINSSNLLNTSMSSQESVSPIFGTKKKIHGSLSSLEASVSSLDSTKGTERVMVTSADSGIEYSLQQPSDLKEDNSSNEGTLTKYSSLKDTALSERGDFIQSIHDTLTSTHKRTSSLLDVPSLKTKGVDRVRKISFVAPSASFHGQKPDAEAPKQESKLPTNLEKLLSLFHNPGSLFSRSNSQIDEERKSASNTPPRREPVSLTSSFWSWGNADKGPEKEEEGRDSSPENTDSTLSERVQVSYVDESFSKKLDSKTSSTDTDNTLSEFQSSTHCTSEGNDVTIETTDDNIVQNVDLSLNAAASPNGNETSGEADLNKPNDMNRNVYDRHQADEIASAENSTDTLVGDAKALESRPRSFAAVLKSSATENTDRQASPDAGQSVNKLPSKVIRGIKENISPENTLTSSMTNTKTLALELNERQIKNQPIVNAVWEVTTDKGDPKTQDAMDQSRLEVEPQSKAGDASKEPLDTSKDSGVTLDDQNQAKPVDKLTSESREAVDLGKDALSYLIYENQDFEPDTAEAPVVETKTEKVPVLAEELRDADLKLQNVDLSPELVIDLPTTSDSPEVFTPKDLHRALPAPERAKVKSNSLEDLSQRLQSVVSMGAVVPMTPKSKPRNIVFNVPETCTTPRDIPERRTKLRSRSGSSPKSLPASLKLESVCKKKKKVSSLGKIARDSLLALNRTEDEIADIRREYKLTSVESLRSLESVSEDANSQSGNSADSRCRCLRASQESLMSLDSISEDCRCDSECDKSEGGHTR